VLGTMKQLEEHHEMMKQHQRMHHDEPHWCTSSREVRLIVWQFTRPGDFYYGAWWKTISNWACPAGLRRGRVPVPGPSQTRTVRMASTQQRWSRAGGEMRGMYGPYRMERESSGTSWQPDASPHQGFTRRT